MSWSDSSVASKLWNGPSRPARTNVKHANGARCACFSNSIKREKKNGHNQLPPIFIYKYRAAWKKKQIRSLFSPIILLPWRRRRKMSSSDCQIRTDNVFTNFFLLMLTTFPHRILSMLKKKEINFAAVLKKKLILTRKFDEAIKNLFCIKQKETKR